LPYAFLLKAKTHQNRVSKQTLYFSQVFHQTSCQHITVFPYFVHITTKSNGFKGGLGVAMAPLNSKKENKNVGKK
jgi:hypothetical protein